MSNLLVSERLIRQCGTAEFFRDLPEYHALKALLGAPVAKPRCPRCPRTSGAAQLVPAFVAITLSLASERVAALKQRLHATTLQLNTPSGIRVL